MNNTETTNPSTVQLTAVLRSQLDANIITSEQHDILLLGVMYFTDEEFARKLSDDCWQRSQRILADELAIDSDQNIASMLGDCKVFD